LRLHCLLRRVDANAKLNHRLSINEDEAARDQLITLSTRRDAVVSEIFIEANLPVFTKLRR